MRLAIGAPASGLWAWLSKKITKLVTATSDYAWYLDSTYSTGLMAQAKCQTPSLRCIRKAQQLGRAIHYEREESEQHARKARLVAAEQERARAAKEQEEWEEIVKKALAYDKLSAEDFTFNIRHHHVTTNYINIDTLSQTHVDMQGATFHASCATPSASATVASHEDMAAAAVNNRFFEPATAEALAGRMWFNMLVIVCMLFGLLGLFTFLRLAWHFCRWVFAKLVKKVRGGSNILSVFCLHIVDGAESPHAA